jgi:hypothetical protein
MAEWQFLTNHAHVLICLAAEPTIRLRDVADQVGITERAAHRIVSELVEDGYVRRKREGRRNSYQVKTDLPLRHPLQEGHTIGQLLCAVNGKVAGDAAPKRRRSTSPQGR